MGNMIEANITFDLQSTIIGYDMAKSKYFPQTHHWITRNKNYNPPQSSDIVRKTDFCTRNTLRPKLSVKIGMPCKYYSKNIHS